jgi:hypothetical protein
VILYIHEREKGTCFGEKDEKLHFAQISPKNAEAAQGEFCN